MSYMSNCAGCQSGRSDEERSFMGCGLLAPSARKSEGWNPPALPRRADRTPLLTVCPGYTTQLPPVREARAARQHWKNGTLTARYDGRQPTAVLLDALEIDASAQAELEAWLVTPKGQG